MLTPAIHVHRASQAVTYEQSDKLPIGVKTRTMWSQIPMPTPTAKAERHTHQDYL